MLQRSGLGSSHVSLVSAGLQDPPVCGAHGPRLLPAERPSFLQAVPREAECRRVLLRAPRAWGPELPAGPSRGPFPDSVSLPDLLSHTFLLSHNRDQPVMSATGPEPPPPPRPPPSSKVGVAGDTAPQTFTPSSSPLGTGSLPHHAQGHVSEALAPRARFQG